MNLTYGVIAVVGVLIAISLALIVADPNETPASREIITPENNIAQIEEDLTKLSVNPSLLTSTTNVGGSLVFEVEFMDDDAGVSFGSATIRDKDIAIKTPTTAITPYVRFISSTC